MLHLPFTPQFQSNYILCGLGSRTPLFTNNSVHEQIFRAKKSWMTNGFSDYEHASWQQRQAESISAGVSCWLILAQYTSLLDFGLWTFRFTNGLQERIKFVNRGPTVYYYRYVVYFLSLCYMSYFVSSSIPIVMYFLCILSHCVVLCIVFV
jgi:hypothetical protein